MKGLQEMPNLVLAKCKLDSLIVGKTAFDFLFVYQRKEWFINEMIILHDCKKKQERFDYIMI